MSTAEARRARNKAQDDEDAAQLKLGPEFQNEEQTLTISEVKILLGRRENVTTDNPVYKKTLDYVQAFSRFHEEETVRNVRATLSDRELKPFELAQIANLCPLESDEAKALIPSLTEKDDDELQSLLNEIASYRKFQG
ncbi:hypothetical protein RQP46_006879 [Phenoliferia psychrophenolica]